MTNFDEKAISEQGTSALAPAGVRSVYLEGIKFLRIERQPEGRYNHVTPRDNMLTSFQLAERYGNLGLIAHNYLAGRFFFQLKIGDMVYLMNVEGKSRKYKITQIMKFRALKPRDPSSLFEDLESGDYYSAAEVFRRVYMGKHHIVLQTCIAQGELREWGRLFLIGKLEK